MTEAENEQLIDEEMVEEELNSEPSPDLTEDIYDDVIDDDAIEIIDEDSDSEDFTDASETDDEDHRSLQLKDPSTVTDEELDTIADTAIEVLQSIFEFFDTDSLTIDEYVGDEGELILDVNGENLGILIGRHGKTLEALHVIVTSICFQKLGYRFPIIVDIEGYKSRLRQKIESIARSSARRAVSQRRAIHLRPMTAFERRIVHIALRNDKKVMTESDGRGPDRHVVIIPV